MKSPTLFLALLPLLAAATPNPSPLAGFLAQARALHARQLDPSAIPLACRPTCTVVLDDLDACTTPTCTCSAANAKGLAVCVNCIVGLDPSQAVIDRGQLVLVDYEDACAVAGFTETGLSVTIGPAVTPSVTPTTDPFSVVYTPVSSSGGVVTSGTNAAPSTSPSGVTISVPNPTSSTSGGGLGGLPGLGGGALSNGAGLGSIVGALIVGFVGIIVW
ncbi:hypothetical protein FA95DRAFT_248663 [Auriscalpium vulgare]|uniref:Uncharacterized protein n=1 Tax=Auriscalpium vulgare TaxID=40419 RepID=A0ACB8RLC1_9AGAM|nr:hypothetical protein FA95DRAFT_248663 [Auriscalpium vulgare]